MNQTTNINNPKVHPTLQQRMPCLNPIYPEHYQQLFLDVYTKIQNKQYTEKTNDLIQKLITFGQSNYSCWVAKKHIYYQGNTTIEHQDQYSAEVLKDNLKNFQIWDYRNFITDVTKNYEKQYNLMDQILQLSPKNYHLWSNRTRVVSIVKNFGEQIVRTQKFILKDLYNNSAWTYRAFCYQHIPVKDYQSQFSFTIDKIKKYIDNQAAWNYLRGYFPCYKLKIPATKSSPKQQNLLSYADYPIIKETCKQIIQNKQIKEKKKIQALLTILIIDSHKQDTVQYAKQVCGYLVQLQPMKYNFYNWLKNSM